MFSRKCHPENAIFPPVNEEGKVCNFVLITLNYPGSEKHNLLHLCLDKQCVTLSSLCDIIFLQLSMAILFQYKKPKIYKKSKGFVTKLTEAVLMSNPRPQQGCDL